MGELEFAYIFCDILEQLLVVIVFTLNLVPERIKYVTVKCLFKRDPPLLSLIAIFYAYNLYLMA